MSQHPWLLVAFGAAAVLIWRKSNSLAAAIQEESAEAWTIGFKPHATAGAAAAPSRSSVLKRVRMNGRLNDFAEGFQRRMLPKLLLVGMVGAAGFILWNWVGTAVLRVARHSTATTNTLQKSAVSTFEFDTRDALAPAPVLVEAGQRYRIRVQEDGPWLDNSLSASANGLVGEPSLVQKLWSFARRDPNEPWFKVMAAIGPNEDETIPIGKDRVFTAKTSGRLYLFVNDAHGFYGNNHGTATITVEWLDAPALTGK